MQNSLGVVVSFGGDRVDMSQFSTLGAVIGNVSQLYAVPHPCERGYCPITRFGREFLYGEPVANIFTGDETSMNDFVREVKLTQAAANAG